MEGGVRGELDGKGVKSICRDRGCDLERIVGILYGFAGMHADLQCFVIVMTVLVDIRIVDIVLVDIVLVDIVLVDIVPVDIVLVLVIINIRLNHTHMPNCS